MSVVNIHFQGLQQSTQSCGSLCRQAVNINMLLRFAKVAKGKYTLEGDNPEQSRLSHYNVQHVSLTQGLAEDSV